MTEETTSGLRAAEPEETSDALAAADASVTSTDSTTFGISIDSDDRSLALPGRRNGVTCEVENLRTHPTRCRLELDATEPGTAHWFEVSGDAVFSFGPREKQQATVVVRPERTAATGRYGVRLRAVNVAAPETDVARSDEIVVDWKRPPIERNRMIRLVVLAVVILAVLGFVVNRLNVSVTGMEGAAGVNYLPSWMEVAVSVGLVAIGFAAFALVARSFAVFPEARHRTDPLAGED